jgi:hypothetical protein
MEWKGTQKMSLMNLSSSFIILSLDEPYVILQPLAKKSFNLWPRQRNKIHQWFKTALLQKSRAFYFMQFLKMKMQQRCSHHLFII